MNSHLFSELAALRALMVQLAADLQSFKEITMATEAQLLVTLGALTTEIGNIAKAVTALVAAQGAAGSTTAAEDAAVAALQTALDSLKAAATPATPAAP